MRRYIERSRSRSPNSRSRERSRRGRSIERGNRDRLSDRRRRNVSSAERDNRYDARRDRHQEGSPRSVQRKETSTRGRRRERERRDAIRSPSPHRSRYNIEDKSNREYCKDREGRRRECHTDAHDERRNRMRRRESRRRDSTPPRAYTHTRVRSTERYMDRRSPPAAQKDSRSEPNATDEEAEGRWESTSDRNEDERPSHVLRVRGLPDTAQESDVRAFFGVLPGVVGVRLLPVVTLREEEDGPCGIDHDPGSSSCTGEAYLEMVNVDAAVALMATGWRTDAHYGPHRLLMEYFFPDEKRAKRVIVDFNVDWRCPACHDVNFAKRKECRTCARPRTAAAEPIDKSQPSASLRFEGLPVDLTANLSHLLEVAIKPIAPLQRIRLLRDKTSNLPTGTAIVHLFSKEDAAQVMEKLGSMILSGCSEPCRISYSLEGMADTNNKDKETLEQAAEVELNASGWEPVAFDEAALDACVDVPPQSSPRDDYDLQTRLENVSKLIESTVASVPGGNREGEGANAFGSGSPNDTALGGLVPQNVSEQVPSVTMDIGTKTTIDVPRSSAIAVIQAPAVIKCAKPPSQLDSDANLQNRAPEDSQSAAVSEHASAPLPASEGVVSTVRGVVHRGRWAQRFSKKDEGQG